VKERGTPEDLSDRPDTLHATLSQVQEANVVELRTTLLLPTDDLFAVTSYCLGRRHARGTAISDERPVIFI
jgi:hypothetical protein